MINYNYTWVLRDISESLEDIRDILLVTNFRSGPVVIEASLEKSLCDALNKRAKERQERENDERLSSRRP
jgi:hypothetical protein